MNCFSKTPNLKVNDTNYLFTNSFLCAYFKNEKNIESLILRWYNSLTLMFAEMFCHSLGGGMTIYVPKEISQIRIFSKKILVTNDIYEKFLKLESDDERYLFGDEFILKKHFKLKQEEIKIIKNITKRLKDWRSR